MISVCPLDAIRSRNRKQDDDNEKLTKTRQIAACLDATPKPGDRPLVL
jgi:hypothetical protein